MRLLHRSHLILFAEAERKDYTRCIHENRDYATDHKKVPFMLFYFLLCQNASLELPKETPAWYLSVSRRKEGTRLIGADAKMCTNEGVLRKTELTLKSQVAFEK